eukprot:CAMPEP_0173131978 /NCGR_PEP_ID=MMETSP1102-20130122/60969_1 /TAXON_ID=49646 /ORGANISM="Geminigera sp., Strain Caron Lab Isolate" /LENGTH=201 /DNA_ID=CAMNT_0014043411 /DNA_START=50 /DNA_END=652 /DNA_ORIENTATION=-
MSRHTGFQQIGEDDSSVAPSRGVSDITGIELGSVMSGEGVRDTVDSSICSDLLQAVFCGLVIVGAIFGAHWLVVVSSSHHKHKSRHHWAGTDSVSNNVRLEVEKNWLGGQKSLPTGSIFHESIHHGKIDVISAHQFQEAVNRLHQKASRQAPPPPSSSLLVPIDDITGSRGGNVGLNHIPLRGDDVREGGGELDQDDEGVW